jgi:hypothetical protein
MSDSTNNQMENGFPPYADLEQNNEIQSSSVGDMFHAMPANILGFELGEVFVDDDNDMENNRALKFDIDIQLRILEELKLLRTDIQTLRINSMIIKEEVRTNTELTKLLWITLNSTRTHITIPSTQQNEKSVSDDRESIHQPLEKANDVEN